MIVQCEFAGWSVTGGVSQKMAQVLRAVEARLRAEQTAEGDTGSLADWIGLDEPVRGARGAGQGSHSTGNAVDVNYETAPYIATRSGGTYGGEKVDHPDIPMRQRAVQACDNAVAYSTSAGRRADLSIRLNDTIGQTYDRFRLASDALLVYFAGVMSFVPRQVARPPIPHVHTLADGSPAFDALRPQLATTPAEAIAGIQRVLGDPGWQEQHPGWPLTAEQQYWQILRDFELVRIPMLYGAASGPVTRTRNPARGFLPFRREFVVAMIEEADAILPHGKPSRWGASDFGAPANGDIQHFDLGYQAAYD